MRNRAGESEFLRPKTMGLDPDGRTALVRGGSRGTGDKAAQPLAGSAPSGSKGSPPWPP